MGRVVNFGPLFRHHNYTNCRQKQHTLGRIVQLNPFEQNQHRGWQRPTLLPSFGQSDTAYLALLIAERHPSPFIIFLIILLW